MDNIHPSRRKLQELGGPGDVAAAERPAKKPKVKTAAQKRYLAKKNRKHKILAKAKRDAAPKNKQWNVDGTAVENGSDTSGSDTSDDDEDMDQESAGKNAEAGPSRLPESNPETEQEKAVKKKKKAAKEDSEDEEVDVAAERERRKREKREKRAARDKTEKRKLKEEKRKKEAEKGKSKVVDDEAPMPVDPTKPLPTEIPAEDSSEDEAVSGDEPGADDKISIDGEEEENTARKSSPVPLHAFPLPTPAPAPDPALLSRQGLPANLENATFVDQNLSLPVGQLEVQYEEGPEKGLGDMEERLKSIGVEEFFAVQAAMLPKLLPLPLIPSYWSALDDYLISAPTGSGKTLAYAIPIVRILSKRTITRLRALIVLPTRDLVVQVRETLEILAKGTGLTIGSATGQHSFSHEQNAIIEDQETKLLGGSSKVDILIATPGRLIDHINHTPNFSLQHLRFLVIDEADRLLNQSFHNWLAEVLQHTRPPTRPIELPPNFRHLPWDHVAEEWMVAFGLVDPDSEFALEPISMCQKLLFSATLTRDPAAIASLQLRNPQYFIVNAPASPADVAIVGESFTLPTTLQEKYLALPPALKPLNLIHLMHDDQYAVKGGLVFTKSVENVHRLAKLLEFFEDEYAKKQGKGYKKIVVKSYTSDLKPGERKTVLKEFSEGKVHMLICSDLIARGMDLPTVEHVVSYDTPVDMRKYVHRVGRTARAGRSGTAWTLVEKQEALHFKKMLKTAGHEKKVKKVKVKETEVEPYKEAYEAAMVKLKEVYVRKVQ